MAELHKIYTHAACGSGSVLLWWRCDLLCTSGFVDNITFLHSGLTGLYGASYAFPSGDSETAETILHRFRPNFTQR